MRVLVLNCGSSSVKYKLFNMEEKTISMHGTIERIGMASSRIKHKVMEQKEFTIEQTIPDHQKAVESILQLLTHSEFGALHPEQKIHAVGHRVVHGGEYFHQPVLVKDDVIEKLERCSEMAPLHNPPNVMGIKICRNLMPGVIQTAVFDTAFHQTMPDYAYTYALPYKYYKKYRTRKYGFHGTSHKYVSNRAAEIIGADINDLNILTCHLGNGSSLCAVRKGKSIDTTMGFTPMAGVAMGTRCGNLDPAIIPFLAEKEKMDWHQITDLLNKQSGVLGVSGLSSDFRDLEKAAGQGHHRSRLALDVFIYSVIKEIGALTAAMDGLDVLVFTAGIGENSPEIRQRVCSGLSYMGVELDQDRNNIRGIERIISMDQSKVKVLVVPTDEELMIAKETTKLYERSLSHKSA